MKAKLAVNICLRESVIKTYQGIRYSLNRGQHFLHNIYFFKIFGTPSALLKYVDNGCINE